MNKDGQKNHLWKNTEKKVEYRDRPARTQPRRRNMQAKKVKAKAKNRKRNLILFYLSVFVVIIAAAITLSLTVLFKISTVEVTGTSRYSAEEIIKESEIAEGSNLFLFHKDQAIRNIMERLPYVGQVTISRKLPGTVTIHVADAVIAGAIPYNGGYLIIDHNGKALEQSAELPQGYPEITGLRIAEAVVGNMLVYEDNDQKTAFTELLEALTQSGLDKITQIDVSDTYNLKAVYDGRITMNFGIATDLDYKARFAKSIFDSGNIQSTERGTLNLTVVTDNNKVYFSPDYSALSSQAAA